MRASKKLRSEELLITGFAPTRLRMELDRIPLWRGNHVPVKQLVEDFARYLYLPRLRDASVLLGAVRDGLSLLTWEQDAFAYADSYDESAERYRGLRWGQHVAVTEDDTGLLVQPAVARQQQAAEAPATTAETPGGAATGTGDAKITSAPGPAPGGGGGSTGPADAPLPRRFHGTVDLDPARVGRDASRIADEVLSHLAGLVGARVKVTLEIEAEIPGGAPAHVVRTVTENGRTLKFTSQGFEVE